MRTFAAHPLRSSPPTPHPLLSVNFQIFILHYILSSYMKRAFKQKAIRSVLFFTSPVCAENVQEGFANDVYTMQC